MNNLYKTTYKFKNDLSFSDMCKIVAKFVEEGYSPFYFLFDSRSIKDYQNRKFNLTMEDKEKNNKIELDISSVSFYSKDAKESFDNYEKVIDLLIK